MMPGSVSFREQPDLIVVPLGLVVPHFARNGNTLEVAADEISRSHVTWRLVVTTHVQCQLYRALPAVVH